MDADKFLKLADATNENDCPKCGRPFLYKWELDRHLAGTHTEIEVEFSVDSLECQLCGDEFSTKRGLGQHIKRVHKDNAVEVHRFYNGVSVAVLHELYPEAAIYAEGNVLVIRELGG